MSEAELAEKIEKIDRQRVEELATKFQEPDWLRDNRLESWEAYMQMPMPGGSDEEWRHTDLSALDLTKLQAFNLEPAKQVDKVPQLPQWFSSAVEMLGNNAGILFQTTHNGGYLKLSKELAEQGVIYCDLATAIDQHAEKIRPFLTKNDASRPSGKFNLLTKALYNCGAFLFIPKGVVIKEPFLLGLGFSAHSEDTGAAIFPRVVVVAEEHSEVDLVFAVGREAEDAIVGKQLSLASILIDVHSKAGAKVKLLEVQEFGSDVFVVEEVNSHVAPDAEFNSLSVATGGKQAKADIATYLDGPGAASNVLGVLLGSDNEHFNFNTIQEHNAPDTSSKINYRVAVKDTASSVYQGIIKVAPAAQRIDAFQTNKNLLLSPDAKANSIPKLEILANDVKCSHGATVGPVDREQIFYLRSRGLNQLQAEELIVLGFFQQVLEEFPLPTAHAWLTDVISRKACKK